MSQFFGVSNELVSVSVLVLKTQSCVSPKLLNNSRHRLCGQPETVPWGLQNHQHITKAFAIIQKIRSFCASKAFP